MASPRTCIEFESKVKRNGARVRQAFLVKLSKRKFSKLISNLETSEVGNIEKISSFDVTFEAEIHAIRIIQPGPSVTVTDRRQHENLARRSLI